MPSSVDGVDVKVGLRPLGPRRTKSHDKQTSYSLFPTIEPTPPASPTALQKLSLSKTGNPRKSRSTSLDETARIAAEQQNAAVKTVGARRGRKGSIAEIRHMSTVQEMPSPTVSISYSFLPRYSEDAGHARSSSAPGEFVRDSQTLPNARVDLSKPQWTSKQADGHPIKGLGLSLPASLSADRIDQRREAPNAKSKPNLTIEIKNDARMKPNAVVVRDEDFDDDKPPPPPPPKSPRHDSRNHSLSNIPFEPARKVRRTHSKTASGTLSKRSSRSPDSAHPSEKATVASQGSFVKAALVDTPSPSPSSPPPTKPVIPHTRQESFSPLSGDVKIKELMAMTSGEAQDDLERPIPPPITPGLPRVASLARVVSIPSLPKAISVEKSAEKSDAEQHRDQPAITQPESKSTETIIPIKQAEDKPQATEEPSKKQEADSLRVQPVTQGSKPDLKAALSPAVSSTKSRAASTKPSKLNLDKPMPSLPPPSSRFSEHMRQVRAAEGTQDIDAPPVPTFPDPNTLDEKGQDEKANQQSNTAAKDLQSAATSQAKVEGLGSKQSDKLTGDTETKERVAVPGKPQEKREDTSVKGFEKASKGLSLSAFPSVPAPPQYYARGARGESPSGRTPPNQRPPPRDARQRGPARDNSPAQRFPPGHPMNRPVHPPFMPGSRNVPKEPGPGPPRSRFYGRQSESANNSQTSLAEQVPTVQTRDGERARGNVGSPDPNMSAQNPANSSRSPPALLQTPPTEQRTTPALEAKSKIDDFKEQRPRDGSEGKHATPDAKPSLPGPSQRVQNTDHLTRPQSPANLGRAPSPTPSMRPGSPGDLLNKFSSAKSLPSLPPEHGPRTATPDAASVLTLDARATSADPIQTLKDLTRQSEALHARHASLRADRLKLSTAISGSLKESKPGPEYANSLLDQHLSLNAINSSLDICFAKLKSLDCKKEEAIQALVEQSKERELGSRRHRATASVATHSTQASISGHSREASTPDIGPGVLPAVQKDTKQAAPLTVIDTTRSLPEQTREEITSHANGDAKNSTSTSPSHADSERDSLAGGLPTPKPIAPADLTTHANEKMPPAREVSPADAPVTRAEPKRNTMVKLPSVSPAPSLFAGETVELSPVSPIEDADKDSIKHTKRITVKGAKAAKILGLVSGRSESPSGITLPDASPTETRGSPGKGLAIEMRIQRKPLPGASKASVPPPPHRQAPVPPQPGRKRTNDSASTVQTDSSPESEIRTPRGSQEGMVPKGLKIGRKQRPPQPVQVVNDDDILDYYAR